MILDGAGWHRANDLTVPENMRLEALPPYSPQLNPVEHIWDEIRKKWFTNEVFNSLVAVEDRLVEALVAFSLPTFPPSPFHFLCGKTLTGWGSYAKLLYRWANQGKSFVFPLPARTIQNQRHSQTLFGLIKCIWRNVVDYGRCFFL